MADGLIHKKDGTIIDPVTKKEVNGANFGYVQINWSFYNNYIKTIII